MLLEHFTNGTETTVTGAHIGCEIETDFVDIVTGVPIDLQTSRAILAARADHPSHCELKLELGRQKIELAIAPAQTFPELLERTHLSLGWLYGVAQRYGARPIFEPEIDWPGDLLAESTNPRDQVWVQLDGRPALEELCRCSSVQFTVDVNPRNAIEILNTLSQNKVHELDYEPNDQRWQRYIAMSRAGYAPDRYAGPLGFDDLTDYATKLARHDVVMHQGQPVRRRIYELPKPNVDLFLRSVWWHYRLRRYLDTLTVEIRPFARRGDDRIERYWQEVAPIFGL